MEDLNHKKLLRSLSVYIAFATALFISSLATSIGAFAAEPGQQVSDLSVPTVGGADIGLRQFKGKIIYLDIWASWCATCVKSLTWMQSLQDKFGKDTFQVLAVNVDEDPSDAEKVLKSINASLLVAFDPTGTTPAALNIDGVPTSYLIGRDGRILSVHRGLNKEDQNEIESQITNQLTKSIGEPS